MNWICKDCEKSYSIFTERCYNSCRECVIIKQEKKAKDEHDYLVKKVNEFISIFKYDTEKFYKTIAVLAVKNGIEYDESNNNAIIVRGEFR